MALTVDRQTTRLRALMGFSRALQATLSVAQPFFAALIALHGFPSVTRTILGTSAAFAGFWAVFALNDLLDVSLDRTRFAHLRDYGGFDIDSAGSRHPLAQRQITPSLALWWIICLASYALVVAYLLNPYSALLFAVAGLLETAYCKLARVSPFKFLVSGAMVGTGTLAGWLAMSNEMRLAEMALVFLLMSAWEIGGRNIVNDFADVDEDVRLGIKTVPVVYGPAVAARLTLLFLLVTALLALIIQPVAHPGLLYLPLSLASGTYLLLWPGLRLWRAPTPQTAMRLFNRASLYPPAMLAALIVSIYVPLR